MHRFVVVASRGAPTIGERTIGLLSDPAPPSLPFDPHDHVLWRSSNELVHVASWSADEVVRPTARTVEGGIVALGGLPIVTQPSDAAALLRPEDVAGQLASLEALTERLDGPYAIVTIRPDGAGTAVNDPFGLHPLYLGEFGSSCVLANDAALVAAVLESLSDRVPEPDEDAVAWLLLNGQMFGDATPYRGVRRLPFGSAARFERDRGVTVVPWHEPPWPRARTSPRTPPPTFDVAEARMIATISAAIAARSDAVSSELTAGRDSRLVLELTAARGRRRPGALLHLRAGIVAGWRRGRRDRPQARVVARGRELADASRRAHAREFRRARSAGFGADPLLGDERARARSPASCSPALPARVSERTIQRWWA